MLNVTFVTSLGVGLEVNITILIVRCRASGRSHLLAGLTVFEINLRWFHNLLCFQFDIFVAIVAIVARGVKPLKSLFFKGFVRIIIIYYNILYIF